MFAVDIAVLNPDHELTTVYAPQSGTVRAMVLKNKRWGTKSEDRKHLNWIHVEVDEFEFYEIAHVTPLTGKTLLVGDQVEKGEPILVASLNGRMTKTNDLPDSHVHMLVGVWLDKNGFV